MTETEGKAVGLDGALAVWSRRKWIALIAFAVPLVTALSVIAFVPNIYRSTATVLVDRQQIPETFVRSTVTSALETRFHTISQEILSRSRLEALITRFDLYSELRKRSPLEQVIERMRRDIKLELKGVDIKGQREATVAFAIGFQGSDPATVALVANTLASFYIEENLKARERQATGTAEFLKVQLTETKSRLDSQEQRVSGFKRRHMGELPQQMEANLATLERLHAQLRLNADNQTRAAERRQVLSSQLAEAESLLTPVYTSGSTTPVMVSGPPESHEAVRLAQKRLELNRLLSQFNDRYPDVVQLRAEIAAMERAQADAERARAEAKAKDPQPDKPQPKMAASPAAPLTPYVLRVKEALNEAQADMKVLKTEEARLREGIAAYQTRVENVPRREQEFIELSRDYESTRELYQSLMKRYEEAVLAESMEQRQKGEQFRVLDPAVPRPEPAAPDRLRMIVLALAGSIGLAVAAVLIAEHVDTSFHTVDDLRAFSPFPVLVSIPRIVTEGDLSRGRWRMRLAASAALVSLVMIIGLAYVVAHGNEQLVLLLSRGGAS
jgi:polysaccharide chain length determinant protein (PEP-CTERM system associated)